MGVALVVDNDSDRPRRGSARVRLAWSGLSRWGRRLAVLGAAGMSVATGLWLPVGRVAAATLAAGLVLVAAAVVDAVEHRLPNELVLAAAVAVLVGGAASAAAGTDAWRGALVAAALVGLPLLACHLVSPRGLGFGDVKAATALGGALGLLAPVVAAGALFAGLLVTAIHALAGRHRAVPLGPGLVVGAIVALAVSRVAGVEPW